MSSEWVPTARTLPASITTIRSAMVTVDNRWATTRARLRAEAESLRNDPEDGGASRDLAAEMDAIRAW